MWTFWGGHYSAYHTIQSQYTILEIYFLRPFIAGLLHQSGSCQKTLGTFKRDDWEMFNEEAIYKDVVRV